MIGRDAGYEAFMREVEQGPEAGVEVLLGGGRWELFLKSGLGSALGTGSGVGVLS
ncbi:MAG: hypothetical protein HC904_17635 [Blastochloris sp.]|nr:hypothetical protein [Blastochloris sp.]